MTSINQSASSCFTFTGLWRSYLLLPDWQSGHNCPAMTWTCGIILLNTIIWQYASLKNAVPKDYPLKHVCVIIQSVGILLSNNVRKNCECHVKYESSIRVSIYCIKRRVTRRSGSSPHHQVGTSQSARSDLQRSHQWVRLGLSTTSCSQSFRIDQKYHGKVWNIRNKTRME